MVFNIRWYNSPTNLWQEYYENVNDSNLLQSYQYGQAQSLLNNQKMCFAILEFNNIDIGCFQMLEAGLCGNLIHAIILDRGPLWFDGYGSEEDRKNFLQAFRKKFPRRWGRKLRFIPEYDDTPQNRQMLEEAGFRHRPFSSYQTRILDLSCAMDDLRAGLKKRWRNSLTKAEKAGLHIEWDEQGEHLNWLLKAYTLDRKTKGYHGPSVKLIYALAKYAIPRKEMWIGRALKDGKPIGAVLILTHGRGATYQIGWASSDGRTHGAHYILLWDALKRLKSRGTQTFDLGGINDDTAKGVKTFKDGMGGRHLTLPGLYS